MSLVAEDKNIEEFTKQQLKIFWLPDEIHVEKDIQDVLVHLTEAERHGVVTTLKLFTIYESIAGDEYWGGRFKTIFKDRIEFLQMASAFSMFEMCVHMPFYSEINKLLHLHTEEFYNSYVDNPVLKQRVKDINSYIDNEDSYTSLAVFSLIEGVILYSSFAFLKHFQSKGKNKLMNIVRGINFSVRDEHLHSIAGAYCAKLFPSNEKTKQYVYQAAADLVEHECEIIDMLFAKGEIDGVTPDYMKTFVKSRANICLNNLGLYDYYTISHNPIAEWFYNGINNYNFNDFFTAVGREYVRDWNETKFTWRNNGSV